MENGLKGFPGSIPDAVIAVRATHSVAQPIPNNSEVALAFDSYLYDTDNMHDAAGGKLICNTPGLYRIWCHCRLDVATTNAHIFLLLNGVNTLAYGAAAGYGNTYFIVATTYPLNVGNYVTVRFKQASGAAVNMAGIPSYSPVFGMELIR